MHETKVFVVLSKAFLQFESLETDTLTSGIVQGNKAALPRFFISLSQINGIECFF